jgi:hypothetical protein
MPWNSSRKMKGISGPHGDNMVVNCHNVCRNASPWGHIAGTDADILSSEGDFIPEMHLLVLAWYLFACLFKSCLGFSNLYDRHRISSTVKRTAGARAAGPVV